MLVEQILNEDIATVAIGSLLGILGAIGVYGGGKALLNKSRSWLEDKAYEYKQSQEMAARAKRMEKYQGVISSISEKFANDGTLSSMISELEKYPYKNVKTRNERSKVLSKISSYVKSKLEPNEAKYLKDILKNLRGKKLQ